MENYFAFFVVIVFVSFYKLILTKRLPSVFSFSLPRSGPQYWLYLDDATMAESGICPFSIPRGDAHSIVGGANPVGIKHAGQTLLNSKRA